jgi:hypothetical protein
LPELTMLARVVPLLMKLRLPSTAHTACMGRRCSALTAFAFFAG